MNKVFIIVLLFSFNYSYAQTIPDFDLIKMEKTSDYKAAEPFVLQTANYLLTTPFDKKNDNRLKSVQFIAKWMGATADHSFVLDDDASKVIRGNEEVIGIYLAALSKLSIENKALPKDAKATKLNAIAILIDYCGVKTNNIRMSKQLKKLAEAKEKGELEAML